jgi:hypothetical protein
MLTNHEEKERRSRIVAIAGTILVHVMVLVSLMILAIHVRMPLPGEGSVEVSFNNNEDSLAENQPQVQVLAQDSITQPDLNLAKEAPVTLKGEEIAVTDKNKKKSVKPETTLNEKPTVIIETPLERTIIHKSATPVNNDKPSATIIQNVPVKPSDQVKPGETPASAKANNNDGKVNGVSFELIGRGSLYLQKPAFSPQFQGKIVISIIVDKEGKVIYASAKDTATSDIKLRQQVENAARKSLFAPDKNAPTEQHGTITYVFVK